MYISLSYPYIAKGAISNSAQTNPWSWDFETQSGNLIGWCVNAVGWNGQCAETSEPSDNAWHHVVGTYNDSTRVLILYIDGKQRNSDTNPGARSKQNQNLVFMGSTGPDLHASGAIDDVRIYNRVLSAQQVADLYNGFSSSCP